MNRNGQILGRGITLFAVIITVFLIIVGFLAMTYFISLGKSSKEIFNVESFNGESVFLLLHHVNNEEIGEINLLDAILIGDTKLGDYLLDYSIKNNKCAFLVVEEDNEVLQNLGVVKNADGELNVIGFGSAPVYESFNFNFITSKVSFIGLDNASHTYTISHYLGECKDE
jgi:hypothetical protein